MAADVGLIVGYALAAIFGVVAFLTNKGRARVQALLNEAANRLKVGQKAYDDQTKKIKDFEAKLKSSRESCVNLEKNLEEAREKFSQHNKELQDVKSSYEEKLDKLTLQNEHYVEESKALTEQLREADSHQSEAMKAVKEQLEEAKKSLEEQQKKVEKESKEKAGERSSLDKENKKLQSDVQKLKAILRKVDPDSIQKSKRKAKTMEQLYTSMKGLRDMAEERSNNWEIALRHFACHILDKQPKDGSPIGPLVGDALEKIGANLVLDEISENEKQMREDTKKEEESLEKENIKSSDEAINQSNASL